MERDEFYRLYDELLPVIKVLEKDSAAAHSDVNQTYGGDLPYSYHLRLTAGYAARFGHLVAASREDVLILFMAAYYHDTLEDARLTYNDLCKRFTRISEQVGMPLPVRLAAEVVYALTNEKGRTREERADERYYAGIRRTPLATFVKMCDRLANVRHSTLTFPPQRMARVYRDEAPHFVESIGQGAVTPLPEEMTNLMYQLFQEAGL